jgi:peptidoglycan hydrolase-like protein with peptidoglycan-binding domain
MPGVLDTNWQGAKQELADASARVGVDPGTVAKIAGLESNYNSEARPIAGRRHADANTITQFDGVMATSTAYGYGQFTDSTWIGMVHQYGEKYGVVGASQLTDAQANAPDLRNNTVLQAEMLAELTKAHIEKGAALGGPNADANVYALHNLGDAGGASFLKALKNNPNERVDAVLPHDVIKNNPALYGDGSMTVQQAYQGLGQQMGRFDGYANDIKSVTPHLAPVTPIIPTGEGHVASHGHGHGHAHAHTREAGEAHAHRTVLKEGMQGHDVQTLQTQLNALGYRDSHGQPLNPDSHFGPQTRAAVEAFQRDHHLVPDGVVDPTTSNGISNQIKLHTAQPANTVSVDDPRNPASTNHALFNNMKELFPGTSDNRLLQFTAACHVRGINDQNLNKVFYNEEKGLVVFGSRGLLAEMTAVDVKQAPPQAEQSVQQIQQHNQQQTHTQAQSQAQQAQINQQQGPTL